MCALGCAVSLVACESPGGSRVWVGGQGFVKIAGDLTFEGEGVGDGLAITEVDFPDVIGRSVSAEVRLGTEPFELMIGQEWSTNEVSTDSYLLGVRLNEGELSAQSVGLYLECVSKFASDDNGGSSLIDGVELRAGISVTLSKSVILDLLVKYGYFDSSDQEGQPGHVHDGGLVLGMRFGLW
jgi:hypothetical protein